MASQSIAFTRRQINRAKATAEASLAGPNDALRAYAPDMLEQHAAYNAADKAVLEAERAAKKEVSEGNAALVQLRGAFDQTRTLLAAKLGTTFEASSSFSTPTDLLNAAENLELELSSAAPGNAWVGTVLPGYTEALDAATKEHVEAGEALKARQKAELAREQAEGQLRPVLVNFRRLVRYKFGQSSREYRELLDRRSRGSDDDPGAESSGGGAV